MSLWTAWLQSAYSRPTDILSLSIEDQTIVSQSIAESWSIEQLGDETAISESAVISSCF